MKKMLIFAIIFISFLVVLTIFNTNPKKQLSPTDYYKNQITLEQLKKVVSDKNEVIVYFYQKSCAHCARVSPIVIPMAYSMDINLRVIDLEEFKEGWDAFNITGTPTIIHFKNGTQLSQIYGEQSKEVYKQWFENNKY